MEFESKTNRDLALAGQRPEVCRDLIIKYQSADGKEHFGQVHVVTVNGEEKIAKVVLPTESRHLAKDESAEELRSRRGQRRHKPS